MNLSPKDLRILKEVVNKEDEIVILDYVDELSKA